MEVDLQDGGIEPLLPEWEELFAADTQATPFSSPGFARSWWPHWAEGARPWLLTFREGGRLVGLAPLVIRKKGPFRTLSELGRQPANYWDVLCLPESREQVLVLTGQEISHRQVDWDAAVFGNLRQGSDTVRALTNTSLRVRRRPPSPYPGMELPDSFEEYLKGLSRNRRSNLRRHLRRLDDGELELQEVSHERELRDAMVDWQRLRVAWWKTREKQIIPDHAGSRFLAFMQDMVAELVPVGLAEVWKFTRDGELVGVAVNLVDDECFYYWFGGYHPDTASLGLGKITVGEGIRRSIQAGRRYFDFMIGRESYKYWFGGEDHYCDWFMLAGRAPRSRAALAASAVLERVNKFSGRRGANFDQD